MSMSAGVSKVLIVDDDPIISQVLGAYFEEHAVNSVLAADNGGKAMSMLAEHPDVDLIVCDLHMPDVDGVEFMNQLLPINCKIPILLISASRGPTVKAAETLAKAYGLDVIGMLPKPIDYAVLSNTLERLGEAAG
jgi:CheY-like chemotaxis protein